jgi:hypothetical protein
LTAAIAPTVWPSGVRARHHGRAQRVHRRQRADGEGIGHCRSAAEAAFISTGPRAHARAHIAEREIFARRFERRAAELTIGRLGAPLLIPAIDEVEQDRGRHDGRGRRGRAHAMAAAGGGERRRHARGRVEAVHRSARQHDGVGHADQVDGIEHVGLARAGRAAAHVDLGGEGAVCR